MFPYLKCVIFGGDFIELVAQVGTAGLWLVELRLQFILQLSAGGLELF